MIIEELICDYLTDTLDVRAYPEKPENFSGKIIFVEKTDSREKNMISKATIAVQSYADSMYESAKLNEDVKEAMTEIIRLDDIAGISFKSDNNDTDEEIKRYRFKSVFEITFYN